MVGLANPALSPTEGALDSVPVAGVGTLRATNNSAPPGGRPRRDPLQPDPFHLKNATAHGLGTQSCQAHRPTPAARHGCKPRWLFPVLLTGRLPTGGSKHPLLGFISSARVAHGTQRNLLLTRPLTVTRGYDSARWKRCPGEGVGKGLDASMVSEQAFSLNLQAFTNPGAL